LLESFEAGNHEHPIGAAAIAELYAYDGRTLNGWAVSNKLAHDSEGGQNWYWFENASDHAASAAEQGVGNGLCLGCHGNGVDFVMSIPVP
jgi:hypothetical protein